MVSKKTLKEMRVRQIEKINKLLGPDNQLSPESFDMLYELDIDELIDIIYELEGKKARQLSFSPAQQ